MMDDDYSSDEYDPSDASPSPGGPAVSRRKRARRAGEHAAAAAPRPEPVRCWLCEYHTHPTARKLDVALEANAGRVNMSAMTSMIVNLLQSEIDTGQLVVDTTCFPVGGDAVYAHITEHVVNPRVQIPHLIRGLQGTFNTLLRESDAAATGEAAEAADPPQRRRHNVHLMAKVSSQITLLYRYSESTHKAERQ